MASPSQNDPHATRPPSQEAKSSTEAGAQFPNVPGYEIVDVLGRGGMGVVYSARQVSLNRRVALKMILADIRTDSDLLHRFRLEGEAVARFQHPQIVQIYEVGDYEGRPYFSFELLEGGSLDESLNGQPQPADDAAQLVRLLAEAIDYSHQRGILHRDLKPANILLTPDGSPKVSDFGLAKRLDVDLRHTRTGEVMGTPSYMAPEQATGQTREIGVPADVYSLGAILYELLTGRPPFQSETPLETIADVLNLEPIPPSRFHEGLSTDLETICLKCLEKSPSRRYPSARELAGDLDRFLNGEPITARPVTIAERFTRSLQQDKLEASFRSWSLILYLLAAIFLVSCTFASVFRLTDQPQYYVNFAQIIALVLIVLAIAIVRGRAPEPLRPLERVLMAIIVGTFLASGTVYLALAAILGSPFDERILYPIWSVLNGVCWFVMGSIYWGRCYLFGCAFFILALVMTLQLDWAPAEYGLLWATVFVIAGRRFSKLRHAAN